jgi:hypothetical protein
MKKSKLITAISVALLASLVLSPPSYAAKRNGSGHSKAQTNMEQGEPVQTLNARQKSRHSVRKAAALRLRESYKASSEMRIVQPQASAQTTHPVRGMK